MTAPVVKLGLIGDNISRSKSPQLHRLAGALAGLEVSYDRLIPHDMGMHFDAVFAQAHNRGYRGLNITYPYKEHVFDRVTVPDPLVRAIGAINTVIFEPDGPIGYNTDYTGFMQAYRQIRPNRLPGTVCLIGTGGVGKAVAFGLLALKATEIRCVDLDNGKANALAEALRALGTDTKITSSTDAAAMAQGSDGIINCTPLGMVGIGGSPVSASVIAGRNWAFDAVYTPVETTFLGDAQAAGLDIISGYELFLNQGIDAFEIFCGHAADRGVLRAQLLPN